MPIRLLALCLTFAAPLLFLGAASAGVVGWSIAILGALSVLLPGGLLSWRLTRAQPTERGDGGQAPSIGRPPSEGAEAKGRADTEVILEGLPDPLILLDREQRLLRGNPAAERLLGRKLAGQDLPSVLRHPRLLDAATTVLAEGGEVTVDFTIPGKVERFFTARLAGLATPGTDGAAAIISLHDVTAVKRAEQMRGDFVANVSHELRTPLANIAGFIETLGGPAREDPEAQQRFLTIMRQESERMARLIDDLLSLSRIELEEHTAPVGRVDIGQILRTVAAGLETKAAAKSMRIEIAAEDLPAAIGDRDALIQVFQNLLDNAVKYGRDSSRVTVTAKPAPKGSAGARRLGQVGLKIEVSDESEGIAAEHIPRLTERFYRVDSARSRKLGGTGLGLAIVKHLVNRHRGILEIESELGKGSRFTVYLPAADTEPAPKP